MRPSILVLGPPAPAAHLAAAFGPARLSTHSVTTEQALRSPGSTLGADLVVFTDPPGSHPMLEAEAYAAAAAMLHVWWDAGQAEVGPFTRQGLGPCPACLAGSATQTGAGCCAALAAWACSLAALESSALLRSGRSELVGASWRWSTRAPGLSLAVWPARPHCPTPGCAQP